MGAIGRTCWNQALCSCGVADKIWLCFSAHLDEERVSNAKARYAFVGYVLSTCTVTCCFFGASSPVMAWACPVSLSHQQSEETTMNSSLDCLISSRRCTQQQGGAVRLQGHQNVVVRCRFVVALILLEVQFQDHFGVGKGGLSAHLVSVCAGGMVTGLGMPTKGQCRKFTYSHGCEITELAFTFARSCKGLCLPLSRSSLHLDLGYSWNVVRFSVHRPR